MDGCDLYHDKKNNIYYIKTDVRCNVCYKPLDDIVIIGINWEQPKSGHFSTIKFYCQEHSNHIKEYTRQTLRITALKTSEINYEWDKYVPMPSDLIERNGGISVFEAAEMAFSGVTIDKTKYANRSNEAERIAFEKEMEDKRKEIEDKDKRDRLLEKEEDVMDFLNELKESKPE